MTSPQEPTDNPLAHGFALLQMGRADAAAAEFARAAAADPLSSSANTGLAAAQLQLEQHDHARETAQRALVLDPENEWALRILATALLRLGDARRASDAALRCVELAPESFPGYIVLAQALLETHDLAGALEAATQAVRLAPEHAATHGTVAQVKLRHEAWTDAERAAREALRLDPEDAAALNNLAIALRRQGRDEEAAPAFEAAARLSPQTQTIRRNVSGLRYTRARQHLTPRTRELLAEDARQRRTQPQTWDRGRARRLRPWWWLAMKRIPPRYALAANIALLAIFALQMQSPGHRSSAAWTVVLALALPFSIRRAWHWWRIRHPGAKSWKPTQTHKRSPLD
jgi:tetratricopeptide (TPR) repeat protein